MCYTLVQASIFRQHKNPAHNIIVDGPSAVFMNRGEDVNIVVKGGIPPMTNVPPVPLLNPRSGSDVILEEDNSIAGFLRRTGWKLFGRKQAESKVPLSLDPSKMALPELFATLANLPASKFDKIADQLIAETLGVGSVVAAPPGFLGGLGLPSLPNRGPGQDPRLGSASTNIPIIASPMASPLGLMSQSMHSFAQTSPVFTNALPLSTVVFPVFVPKDQPLSGPRSLNNPHSNNGSNPFLSSSTTASLDVTQAASHNPLFAFPPSQTSHHPSHHHQPHHQLHIDQEMTSLAAHNSAAGPIAQHPSQHHPLETLNNIVHSGYLREINKLSQHSFPMTMTENRNSATRGQSVSSSVNMNGERGRHQDRWFADPPATQVRSDTRPLFLPPVASSLTADQMESAMMESTKADGRRSSSSHHHAHHGKAYPILDTSSSTPRIYHAPHNPVEILKIFATAYDAARGMEQSRNPSPSSSGHSVNHLQRTTSDKDTQSRNKDSMTTTLSSFPVFMNDDSATGSTAPPDSGTASGTRGDMVSNLRPREVVTYLS